MFKLFGYGCLASLGSWIVFTLLGQLVFTIKGGGESDDPFLVFIFFILIPSILAYYLLKHRYSSRRKTEEELILPFGILSTPFMTILIVILGGFSFDSDLSGTSVGIALISTFLFTFIMAVSVGKSNRQKDADEEAYREEQARQEQERKQKEAEREYAERQALLAAQKRKAEAARAKIKEYESFSLNIIPFLKKIQDMGSSPNGSQALYRELLERTESESSVVNVITKNINDVAESAKIPDRLHVHSR